MASSRPDKGTSRYKARRSWFDTPPLTTLDPPQAAKVENVSKRKSLDVVEILTLTHFTNPPKIIFGKTCIGKTKVRTLLLRNPHDFEQEVIIEKFPYKKKFMVNQTRFTVRPDEVFSLEITWTPEEDGGYREMIQFHVNEVYRLQAFMIGTADKPKPLRKTRKFPIAPSVQQLCTIVQTPALTNIRKNYSPTSKQKAYKMMEELVSCHNYHNDNKENTEHASPVDKCEVIDMHGGNVLKYSWETQVASLAEKQSPSKMNQEEDVAAQTPTPLESTTIVSKQEIDQRNFTNKRHWRHVSNITSPTINMSPIPVNEGNQHGIIVDSYFQAHEMSSTAHSRPEKLVTKETTKSVKAISAEKHFERGDANLTETFVKPQLPGDNTKIRRPGVVEDTVTESSENKILVSSLHQQQQQIARADETRIIQQHETVFKSSNIANTEMVPEPSKSKFVVMSSDISRTLNTDKAQVELNWSPPKLPKENILVKASEISPRTMLDESLTLISQMKVRVRSTESSPKDNTSVNSSLISQGQGIVSPNSFMQDMKSMMQNNGDNKYNGKPQPPSPSLILNSTIPHKTMVNHLHGIRRSLHNSPLIVNIEYGAPKKSQAPRFVSKRRSITSQFQREEIRKITAAAHTVTKDKELIIGDYSKQQTKKGHASVGTLMAKRQSKDSSEHALLIHNPRRIFSNFKKKETGMKVATAKHSPLGKKSPLARRSPLVRKCHLNSMQDFTMKKTKSKIKGRKKSSPLKPFTDVHESNKLLAIDSDLNLSADILTKISQDAVFVTPQKENNFSSSNSEAGCRSIDSSTVVKVKSNENTAEINGHVLNCLFPNEDEQRMETAQNVSLKTDKLFPDIHVVNDRISLQINDIEKNVDPSQIVCDFDDNKTEQVTMCTNDFRHQCCEDTDKTIFDNKAATKPGKDYVKNVFIEAETPMSSQRFFAAMSPSNLPMSPTISLDQSKRDTTILTKSRISDALTAAMNSGKRLFQNTPQKAPSCCTTGDDTEMHENIRIDVEEHYQEIDGSMYVIVKETTNVTKSTTETYMEHLTISPQQFQTPTKLPNSPDLVMSRRSTHVVKSPKIINIASFNKRHIDFIKEEECSKIEHLQMKEIDKQHHTELTKKESNSPQAITYEDLDVKCFIKNSDTFEKESTLLASPARNLPADKSNHPITSVCTISQCLVDYEEGSESGCSEDVTKDSLDTSQSVDSLVSSVAQTNLSLEDNKKGVDLEKNSEEEMTNTCDEEKCIALFRSKHDKNCVVYENDMKQDFKVPILKVNNVNSGKFSTDGSEDEQFYDTMSERYYDALSDTGNPEVEESLDIQKAAESNKHPTSHMSDSYRVGLEGNSIGFQELWDSISVQKSLPVMEATEAGTLINLSWTEQTLAEEMCIDRKEKFEVTEREVFDLCSFSELKPVDEIIRSTPEGKVKRKLRRSVSADNLLQFGADESDAHKHSKAVNFSISPSHVIISPKHQSFRKPMTHSKTKSADQSCTIIFPLKTSRGQLSLSPRMGTVTKLHSQSLSNLSKQSEKPSFKNEHAANKKGITKKANQVTQTVSKQKIAVKGVAQGRLNLIKKKPNAGIPRHPMLFAAKNMYYDERWMEKQERGFMQWLNFVLTPPDEYVAVISKTKIDAGSLSLDTGHVAPRLAPTKEILSFRAYAACRRLNRLRRSACEFYQSESFVNIIHKIEVEVESRRICARKDRMVHADVGVKQKLLDLLLHYSSLWLRIGLETIFGEVLMLQSNQDVLGLSRFILTRLLASPDIAAEFAHQTVPHMYKQGYEAAVSRHIVKKFLLLVYFLDQAKSSRLIDHDPCLFCKDASIKSSKEILIEFSREVLSGEGDITRHLAYLGYTVCQQQRPIDEFDFAVINLSSDLRDGLRLCRILELLAGDNSIMTKLRTPAISRLQKIHNTGVFFKTMGELGLDFTSLPGTVTTAKDIVDGHREKTLALLWQLIIYFQGSIQVNEAHLREEISILMKSLQLKVAMQKIGAISLSECEARRDSGETRLIGENKMLQLILQWCRLVCLHYGIKVENFSVSFSDGRALCCLLHHYHPALLPLSEIYFQTTISLQEMAEKKCQMETNPDLSVDWGRDGGGLMPDESNPKMFEQLLINEKHNYKTLYEKVSALGGVPLMLKFSDMSNTIPNEKVVSTFVSYLCARLLDIREEVRAARIMQMAWRRKQLWRAIQKRQRRTQAAVTIQLWIRPYLMKLLAVRRSHAATCIQRMWRGHSARLFVGKLKRNNQEVAWKERKEQSTLTQQSHLQSCSVQHQSCSAQHQPCSAQHQPCLAQHQSCSGQHQLVQFKEKQQDEHFHRKYEEAVITIQKHIRGLQCRKEFMKKQISAIKIQSLWRRHLAQNILSRVKQDLLNHSAVVIQKWMKRNYCMSRYASQRAAVVLLQKCWRRKQAIQKLQVLRTEKYSQAATVIQRYVRAKLVQRKFQLHRKAAIILQSCWRGKQTRRRIKSERENKAAILIQSFIRSVMCRHKYLKAKMSIIVIQIHWKRVLAERTLASLKVERDKVCVLQRSAIILQTTWRKLQAEKEFKYLKQKRQEHSVIVIQRYYRKFKYNQQIQKRRSAALTIQKAWKMHQARKILAKLKHDHQLLAVVTIQRLLRGFMQRRKYTSLKSAAIVVQRYWRMVMAMRHLNKLRHQKEESSALVLQKNFKMWKHRNYFLSLKSAAVVLQSNWRLVRAQRYLSAAKLMRQVKSAILIQKMWKRYVVHQEFITKKKAALKIQAFWRMIKTRNNFWRIKKAASVIQSWHRANVETKRQRAVYLKQRKSIICIQCWWRCQAARRMFQTMRNSAIVIQSSFMCHRSRQKFIAIKSASLKIQYSYRHYLEGLKVRKRYLTLRHAVIIIQKNFRKYLQKKHIRQEAAVLVLQTAFRKTNTRRRFVHQKLATLTIQKRFREYMKMKKLRQDFLNQRRAACVIQKTYRAFIVKRQYIHFIIKLQSYVRGRIMENQFKKLKNATILIQRRFRANKMSHNYHEAFIHLRTSAIIIQRFYRAVKVRRMVQKKIADQHSAAIKIQAIYRGWSQKQDYLLLRTAVVCLQRRYRSYLAGQAVRSWVRKMTKSVYIIQRRWRSYKQLHVAKREVQKLREIKVRQEEEKLLNEEKEMIIRAEMERRVEAIRKKAAAIVLQRSFRVYMTLKSNARREHAAQIIQKYVRGNQSRIRYNAELKHICHLQHLIRGFVCCRRYERMKLAAKIIQTRWREIREGRRCRSEFKAKLEAVVKIQAYFLMRRQRKIYQINMRRVVIVQALVRTFIQRRRFEKIFKCIVEMQRRVKGNQQMKQDRERFLKLRHCAIKIQTIVRLWLAYRRVQQERLVLKTQAYFKMHQQHSAVEHVHDATHIQKPLMELKWQELETVTKEAAKISIQSSFQRHHQSCQAHTSHFGARIIQQTIKCFLNKHFQKLNISAFIIQRTLRRYVLRRRMIKTQCAVKLQTHVRLYLCRRDYLAQHRSVVLLQAAVRGWRARKLATVLKRHKAAVCLQAGIRGFLVRKKLSPVLKEQLFAVQEQKRQNKAAMMIQASWRGFITRKNIKDKKIQQARKRLQKATQDATNEKTLGYRTSSALDYLLREKNLAHILEALMHLEVSTRLSPKCCEKMAAMNAISVLYRLINSCNRSIPHMELIKYSLNILLNLAKYEKTTAAVIEPQESISSIVDLLQVYRDKASIFNICCMLLWILGHHPVRRALILKNPLIVDRLQSIHVLALRKQRTSQNRQVTQAKMAAMRNFNFSLPVLTPSKVKRQEFRPYWALIGDTMKDFEDPVVAVSYVMDVLQIRPKV